MALSQEVIIAIVGIIVNLPALLLVFWRIWIKRGRSKANRNSGMISYLERVPHMLTAPREP